MLVYRARLQEAVLRVVSLSVRTGRRAAGLGDGHLRTLCCVVIRYAGAGGRVRRHRGEMVAALAPGAEVRVVACQVDGDEVLVSLRPVAAGRGGGSLPGTLADRFSLPFDLQAWGVTALGGARAWLGLACRARQGALALRGTVRLVLDTPGGPLRLRIPFLRAVTAPGEPYGLRWSASGRVAAVQARVSPGGLIQGEVILAVRCEGRKPAQREEVSPARPPMVQVREVTGQITGLCAEPAGDGSAIVRGAVELDVYGVDATGASRWAGQVIPFAELLNVAEGDRLEATARMERLRHGPAGVQVALALGVTALRRETVSLGGAQYRVERVAGSAATAVILTGALGSGGAPGGPAGGRPAPGASAPGGSAGGRLAPAAPRKPLEWATVPLSTTPRGIMHAIHLPLPSPAQAVTALQISAAGHVEALVKTDQGLLFVHGQLPDLITCPTAATAYPVMQDDTWQLRIIVSQEETGPERS